MLFDWISIFRKCVSKVCSVLNAFVMPDRFRLKLEYSSLQEVFTVLTEKHISKRIAFKWYSLNSVFT